MLPLFLHSSGMVEIQILSQLTIKVLKYLEGNIYWRIRQNGQVFIPEISFLTTKNSIW